MASMKEKYGHNFKTTSKKNEKDEKQTSSGKSMQEKYGHNFTGTQRESQKPGTVIEAKTTQAASRRRGGASPDGIDRAEDIASRAITSQREREEKRQEASAWDVAKKALNTGVWQFDNAVASTLDFVLPTDFLGKYDPASRLSDWTKENYERAERERQETLAGKGKLAQIGSELGVGVMSALPNSILAFLSGGQSAAAQLGAANTGMVNQISNAVTSMRKDPLYWSSVVQTLGSDYDEAKERGANDAEAAIAAIISSGINAAIERSGGIEALPDNLERGGRSSFVEWILSMGDEGKEELLQRLVSGTTQKAVYDDDKPFFSMTDAEAVVHPESMAKEFLMGAGVAGILGGGQIVGANMLNRLGGRQQQSPDVSRETVPAQQAQQMTGKLNEQAEPEHITPEAFALELAEEEIARQEAEAQAAASTRTEVTPTRTEVTPTRTEVTPTVAESETVDVTEITRNNVTEITENTAKGAVSEQRQTERAETPANTQRDTRSEKTSQSEPAAEYGEHGKRVFSEILEKEDISAEDLSARFDAAYAAGRSGLPMEMADLADGIQADAFTAGKMDNVVESTAQPAQTDIAKPMAEDYTGAENNEKKLGELAQELMAYNRVRKDGLVYRFMDSGDGYFVSIERDNSKLDGMIADARAKLFEGGPFATRQEAVEEALAVARRNFYPAAAETADQRGIDNGREETQRQHTEADRGSEGAQSKAGEDVSGRESEGRKEGEGIGGVPGPDRQESDRRRHRVSGEELVEILKKEQFEPERDEKKDHVPLGTSEELAHVLVHSSGFENGDKRIENFYKNNPGATKKEAAEFLKKEFGIGGRTHNLTDGTRAHAMWNSRGIELSVWDSGQKHLFTWAQVDAHYRAKFGMASKLETKSETKAEKKAETKAAGTPQQQIADEVRKYLDKGQDFSGERLFRIANKAYGGTQAEGKYTVKDAYDGMELAVNQYLMNAEFVKNGNGSAAQAQQTLDSLIEMLRHIPTQTKRTEEMESFQQFSTPPNIAYLAAWAANVAENDVVLEPSAGIGGLALWPKAWGATVYANELSERRLQFLNQLGLDGTFNLNAEQIDNLLPDSIRPSVVIMNPPFSSTAGRTSKNATANAKRHIEQALERLEDGGRLVAILGNGMANDAPAFRSWWDELRRENDIRANIQIDGQNYRKYGTTFNVQLVVIDKTGAQKGETKTGIFKDLSKIPAFMEEIRNDRIAANKRNTSVEGSKKAAAGALGGEPLSDTGTQTGDGRLSPGVSETSRTEGVEKKRKPGKPADNSGNEARTGAAVSTDDNIGRDRGNGRTVSSAEDKLGKGSGREDIDSAGGNIEQPGKQVQLELTPVKDKTAAAEVAENPDSIYATYTPKKARIKGAKKHPARLVESAAMAAVEPPDVTYTPALPESIVKKGLLSDAQLENVIYAGQAHGQTLPDGRTKGYFIGDGTGVGKGRQLAGIIMDNFLQGRDKAIWISEKAGLLNDARRDWGDLGGDPDEIMDFSKVKLGQDVKADKGILFTTYDTLKTSKNEKSRLDALKRWLGADFDGVICFDEAHNMANSAGKMGKRGKTKPSAKALAGIELQKAFPKARVVYASATGATDISEYAYLERLGLWGKGTAFSTSEEFISKISTGGLAAMELVARDMKSMGVYMARSISYDDVTYDTLQHELNPMQTEIYNTMSRAWQTVWQNMNEALKVTGADKNGRARGNVNSAFYTSQQRFYNQMITSMSMPSVIADVRRELDNGNSCVIQLVNTNEAQANRSIAKFEDEGLSLDDLDLTPSEMLADMVRKAYPVQEYEEYTDDRGNIQTRPVMDKDGNPVLSKKALRMRDELLEDVQNMKVPDGPLEMLFDAFGVDNVAEVTGRTRRVVEKMDEDGKMRRTLEKRSSKAGIADAQMFQDGKKRILIFSEAGGTGRSYHADLRAKNQQKRVHYLLQPGWSASKATQGFGRTHRSNQASAPIFRLVTTNVMGQKRFTSTIARRLDQLGALTKGQRQAGSGIFSEKDNLENPIAADALATYYKSIDRDVLRKLGLYNKIFDESGKLNEGAEELRDVSKFLNRILSLEVEEQNEVFQGFYDTFEQMMDVAIANGTVDMGLENYRADKIEVMDEKTVRKGEGGADTKYVQMKTYRKTELVKYSELKDWHQDFKGLVRLEDGSVKAVYQISSRTNPKTGEIQQRFKLESPAKGNSSTFVEETLKNKTTAIPKAEWSKAWKEEMNKAPKYNESTLHLLTGTLLPIWDRLPSNNTRVMRVMASDGRQFLGRVIMPTQIDGVLSGLGTNRTMQTYTPQQISQSVLQEGKEAVLRDNRMKIFRRRVSGEWRMEISGQNMWYIARQYAGIITERINYEQRFFIPTGERGEAILSELTKHNPVVDIRKGAAEGIDMMRETGRPDHSDEWTADRVGSRDKKPKSLSEIIEGIRHDFGIQITTGHIRAKDVRGQYNQHNQGIRSRIANDLPTIAHELGHHLDNIYDLQGGLTGAMQNELKQGIDKALADTYSKAELMGEGLAEYVRKYLQNRETAAIDYPEFTKYFLGTMTGKDAALIAQLADEVNAYYSMDADSATSSIRLREEKVPDARTFGEKIRDKAGALYQAWMDSNHGIRLFDEATGSNTYTLASNAAYADAIAGQIIVGDLTDANGRYVAPGLKAALNGIDLNNEEEYRLFGEYLTVRHGPERLREGMRIFADDRKNSTDWMLRRADELERQHPEFRDAAERLYTFIGDFHQTWGVETGLIGQLTLNEWNKRWKNYVPLNRAVSEEKRGIGARRGFANQNSTIRRAKGSGLDIVHPVDNLVNNMVKMVNAGVRNNVMRAITDAADSTGANAAFLERVPAPLTATKMDMTGIKQELSDKMMESGMSAEDQNVANEIIGNLDDILIQYGRGKAHGDIVTVLKGGEPQFWKINDPLMLSSITTMAPKKMEGILDAYAVMSRFMTSNITGNNVVWALFSNFPRDMMTLFTYSKVKNPVKIIGSMGSAYINKINETAGKEVDPLYREYLALGGGHISAYTADRDLAKTARKKLSGKNISANPLEWIAFTSDIIEMGPRFATYKLLRQNGMTEQEAFYGAMDITVNFRRGGHVARELNKVIPFFNASVQGLDKFRRWITAEDIKKEDRAKVVRSRTLTYFAVSGALAALFYAINNGDDEEKEDYHQLSNYTKNSYWNIPLGDGKYFAIPKPRELGVLSSFFETCMEYGIGENKHAFDEFYAYASENFLPAVVSDIAQVGDKGLVETGMGIVGSLGMIGVVGYLGANRDFLGKPIVSSSLQNLEKKDQYTSRTSKIAYYIGQAFNASPTQVDYFFQQVLGGWWKAQKALFPVGSEEVDMTLGVRNTYVKDNQYSNDIVNWMYDKADASAKAKSSAPGDIGKAITAKMDSNMTSFYSRYYKLAKNNGETTATRGTRQLVLDMINEYRKADDTGALTPAQEAVYAVCEAQGSIDYLPAVIQSEIKDGNDRKHTLSDVQYVEYQTDYNRLYWEYVEDNLSKTKGNKEKAAVLTAAKKVAKEQATNRTLARIGAKQTDFKQKYEGIRDNDIVSFEAKVDLANDDGSLKQEEIVEIVSAMITQGLSYDDAYTLFHSRYESDKNNPWAKYK